MPINVLGKTGRDEGAGLLILTECDKILASWVVGRSCLTPIVRNPGSGEPSGHTRGTQSPSLCLERLVKARVSSF